MQKQKQPRLKLAHARTQSFEAGRVIAQGAVSELKDAAMVSGRGYFVEPAGDLEEARATLAAHPDVIAEATVDGRAVHLKPAEGVDERAILKLLLDEGVRIRAFREQVPDLHEVFLELTSGEVS